MLLTVDGFFLQVAAVMGPSGAGKTTFLNALMGTVKYGTISGQVWVNGRAMKMSRLRRIMGFVPQVIFSPRPAFTHAWNMSLSKGLGMGSPGCFLA